MSRVYRSISKGVSGMDDKVLKQVRGIRNILILLLVVVVFIIMKGLSGLLIPLALAGLLTILNLPMVNFLEKRHFPRFLITILVAIVTIVVLWIVITMISGTVEQLIRDQDFLASQFTKKIDAAIVGVGNVIPGLEVDDLRTEVNNVLTPSTIAGLIGSVLGALGNMGSSSIVFLIYYLILLSSATGYHAYVDYVVGNDGGNNSGRGLWDQTEESISTYMGIKTIISLFTGLSAGLICAAFGLQFALFWGFLAFIMNFIPSIGSILATAFPVFMAIIQFDQFGIILALGILLGASQFLIGSVIDPMIMGNRMSLNTVTVIFGLMFWGYIWGIPGMLLSVPLTVVIRLLLDQSEDLSVIARVMGVAPKPGRKKDPLYLRVITWIKERPKKVKKSSGEKTGEVASRDQ